MAWTNLVRLPLVRVGEGNDGSLYVFPGKEAKRTFGDELCRIDTLDDLAHLEDQLQEACGEMRTRLQERQAAAEAERQREGRGNRADYYAERGTA